MGQLSVKFEQVALREKQLQIATGQRESPETVEISGLFVLHDQFRYTLKIGKIKCWSGFEPFQPYFFAIHSP